MCDMSSDDIHYWPGRTNCPKCGQFDFSAGYAYMCMPCWDVFYNSIYGDIFRRFDIIGSREMCQKVVQDYIDGVI
jgi:hypothetical protein